MKKVLFFLMALLVSVASWGGDKITKVSGIVSGSKYYIGATLSNNTDYYFQAYNHGSAGGTGYGNAVESKDDADLMIFTKVTDGWTITFENGNYLNLAADNGKIVVTNEEKVWTIAETNNLLRLTSGSNSLQRNNTAGTTRFGKYANTQKDVWLEAYVSTNPVNSIALDKSELSIVEGKTGTLKVTVDPSTSTVTWSSSDEKVATVLNGTVTALAVGQTNIIVQAGDKKDTCVVTVTEDTNINWYDLVTSANIGELANGDKVMISTMNSENLMGAWSTGAYIEPYTTSLKYNVGRTKCRETAAVLYTLVKDGDYWNLKDVNGKYLQVNGEKKISAGTTVGDAAKLNLALQSNGAMKITSKACTSFSIQYNSQATRFTAYSSGQAELVMYYQHDVAASELSWSPEALTFPSKRLKDGEAADTLELDIDFKNMDEYGVLFELSNESNEFIDFSIVGTDINLATPGKIKVCYYALAAGTGTAEINLIADAANGQKWNKKVPVSVTILPEEETLETLTIAELLTEIKKEGTIGNWGNGTVETSAKEYLLGEVTVTNHVDKWLYVQDATGALCIYDKEGRTHEAGVTYQNGDVLSGIRGKVNVNKNAIDLQPGEGYEVVKVRSVEAIAPEVIAAAPGVQSSNTSVNKYVKVEGVTIKGQSSFMLNGMTINIVNRLGVDMSGVDEQWAHYDIEGYVHANGSSVQLVVSKVSERAIVHVESISLDVTELDLAVGQARWIMSTVLPENANNKKVTWTSSDPTIASVAEGTVTALKYSETPVTITATTEDGGKTATCAVTVSTIKGARYELITKEADLNEGDLVIFTNLSSNYANGAFAAEHSNKYLTGVNSVVLLQQKIVANGAMPFVLGKSGSYWTFTTEKGVKLGAKENTTNGTDMSSTGILTHTITFEGTNAKVTNTANDGKYFIAFNTNSFRYYSSVSGMAPIQLYRKIPGTDPQVAADVEKVEFETKALLEGKASDSETVTIKASDLKPETTITVALKNAGTPFTVSPATLPLTGGDITISYEATAEGTYENVLVVTAQTVYDGALVVEIPVSVTVDAAAPTGEEVTYKLVQKPEYLQAGDKVFFGTVSKDFVLGQYVSGKNIKGVAATYDRENHTVTANDLNAYTVSIDNGKYVFTGSDGKYLCNYTAEKNLSSTETLDNKAKWTLSIADDIATVKNVYGSSFAIYFNYNGGANLFCSYSQYDKNQMDQIVIYSNNAPDYVERVWEPAITVEGEVSSLDWGLQEPDEVYQDWADSRKVKLTGVDLRKDVTVTVSGAGFSCYTSTLTPAQLEKGIELTILWAAEKTGTYTGTLTLSSEELEDIVLTLSATAVDEIPEEPATVTTSKYRVYLNSYFENEEGQEELDIIYLNAKNLKKNLYCKWLNYTGYTIPSWTGEEMTVDIQVGEVNYELAFGGTVNLGTADIENAEITVYVKAFNPGYYQSQLYFYSYKADKETLDVEYRVDLVVNMTTKQTPDPEPNKNPNDKATAMENTTNVVMDGQMYNVLGQRVGEGYRGIVIKNGEKFLY